MGGAEVQLHPFSHRIRWRWVVNFTPRPHYLRKINPVSIQYEAGWTPEPIWTLRRREKFLYHDGFEPRTVQPVAQSIYHLRYPASFEHQSSYKLPQMLDGFYSSRKGRYLACTFWRTYKYIWPASLPSWATTRPTDANLFTHSVYTHLYARFCRHVAPRAVSFACWLARSITECT